MICESLHYIKPFGFVQMRFLQPQYSTEMQVTSLYNIQKVFQIFLPFISYFFIKQCGIDCFPVLGINWFYIFYSPKKFLCRILKSRVRLYLFLWLNSFEFYSLFPLFLLISSCCFLISVVCSYIFRHTLFLLSFILSKDLCGCFGFCFCSCLSEFSYFIFFCLRFQDLFQFFSIVSLFGLILQFIYVHYFYSIVFLCSYFVSDFHSV